MFNFLRKHYDLYPEVLESLYATTPNPENSLLEIIYEQLQESAEEMFRIIDDSSAATCREEYVYDFHGYKVGVKKEADISPSVYKTFIEATLSTLRKGSTPSAILEGLVKMFGSSSYLLELFKISEDPFDRKIFKAAVNLEDSIFPDVITANGYLYLFLNIVKPVTASPISQNIGLADEWPDIEDTYLGAIITPGTGEEWTFWDVGTAFAKNNFQNSNAKYNDFHVFYQNDWEGRLHDDLVYFSTTPMTGYLADGFFPEGFAPEIYFPEKYIPSRIIIT